MTSARLPLGAPGVRLRFVNATSLMGEGFLLGLSSGITCLASCAPVLLPLLVGARGGMRRHGVLMTEYLGGRLAGYLVFGFLVWLGAQSLPQGVQVNPAFKGAVSVALGALMLLHGFLTFPRNGAAKAAGPAAGHSACLVSPWKLRGALARCPGLLPTALGLISGLNLCPPFVVALTRGGLAGSLGGTLVFFLSFFAATALFFVPIPFVGAFSRLHGAAHVASFAGIFVGLFFLYTGSFHLLSACFMS
jgi:hypothetical protein